MYSHNLTNFAAAPATSARLMENCSTVIERYVAASKRKQIYTEIMEHFLAHNEEMLRELNLQPIETMARFTNNYGMELTPPEAIAVARQFVIIFNKAMENAGIIATRRAIRSSTQQAEMAADCAIEVPVSNYQTVVERQKFKDKWLAAYGKFMANEFEVVKNHTYKISYKAALGEALNNIDVLQFLPEHPAEVMKTFAENIAQVSASEKLIINQNILTSFNSIARADTRFLLESEFEGHCYSTFPFAIRATLRLTQMLQEYIENSKNSRVVKLITQYNSLVEEDKLICLNFIEKIVSHLDAAELLCLLPYATDIDLLARMEMEDPLPMKLADAIAKGYNEKPEEYKQTTSIKATQVENLESNRRYERMLRRNPSQFFQPTTLASLHSEKPTAASAVAKKK